MMNDFFPRKICSRVNIPKITNWVIALAGSLFGLLLLVILVLRWAPPPTTAFMQRTKQKAPDKTIYYQWVCYENISPEIKLAVIAAEDQHFPTHLGVDLNATYTAIKQNQHRRHKRGASTITQQVAKNLFLSPSKTLLRKGNEWVLALLIESMWPKKRILEVYLNIAQFGPATFGVESASRKYFRKSSAQISRYEASLLAATLPNPSSSCPSHPSAYLKKQSDHIRRQIGRIGGHSFLKRLE